MRDEIISMTKNYFWELIEIPPRRKIIGNKWVLKVKHRADISIEEYKSRLVSKEYSQQEHTDYEGHSC